MNNSFFRSDVKGRFTSCCLDSLIYFKLVPLPYSFDPTKQIQTSKWIKFRGTDYKAGMFLTITEGAVVKLFELIEFFLYENKCLYVASSEWETGMLNQHFLSYEAITRKNSVIILDITRFDGPPISVHIINNKLYFRKKTDFVSMDN